MKKQPDHPRAGVLAGVRVVEIAGIGPGPFCAMLLADLGAEVISVERPGPQARPRAMQITQRGKKSVILDLKQPEAIEAVLRLVEESDALIEGMRPGVAERLGIGPDACLARNPRLVYGRMTGWGQYGPLSQAAGHDSNYTALAGALWFASPPGQRQVAPVTMLGDIGGGALYLALGILAGVLRARSGGAGQVVDAAIVDGVAHMMNLLLGITMARGGSFDRGTGLEASHWAGRSYRCSDGKWINLAPLEPQFYAELIRRLGLAEDAAFATGHMDRAAWPGLTERLEQLFLGRSQAEWCELLEGTDSCFAPVLRPDDAAQHPHLVDRGVYTRVDGVLQACPAPRFSVDAAPEPSSVPAHGAHTREVLAALGLDAESIERLVAGHAMPS